MFGGRKGSTATGVILLAMLALSGAAVASPPSLRATEARATRQARRWCAHTKDCEDSSVLCSKLPSGAVTCSEEIELRAPRYYEGLDCYRHSVWRGAPGGGLQPEYHFEFCAPGGD